MLDVSDLCGAEGGSAVVLETNDKFVLALRRETALATKVLTHAEALNGPKAKEHREAIDKEMGGLLDGHGVFTYMPISQKPKGATLLGLKLILAEKTGAGNEFLKAKARLVALGNQQVAGRDYDPFAKSSPMLRYSSLRLLCALGALTGRPLSSSDAVQAYLNATLPQPVYGRFPKLLRTYTIDGEELIAFITKALYGLAVSGREWNREINTHLTKPRSEGGMGFVRCYADPCMYVWREGKEWCFLGLATDNSFDVSSSDEVRADVIRRLKEKYEWVDEGDVNQVPTALGAKIKQDLEAGTVTITQEGYIDAMVETFGADLSSHLVQTPASKDLEQHVRDATAAKGGAVDAALQTYYQKLVGSLIFASIVSRPDIAFAVGMLSRAMTFPTEALKKDALRVLNYLRNTKSMGITFSKSTFFSARSGTQMLRRGDGRALSAVFSLDEASSDANFAAGPSISGWQIGVAGGFVAGGSKRQSGTMLCSASSELYAGSVAATEVVHERHLMEEMGFPQEAPTLLSIDNKATVALAHDPQAFQKTKHIERRHHYLRECVEGGDIRVRHIDTEHNPADIFTKALEPRKFKLFRAAIMNLPIESLA